MTNFGNGNGFPESAISFSFIMLPIILLSTLFISSNLWYAERFCVRVLVGSPFAFSVLVTGIPIFLGEGSIP